MFVFNSFRLDVANASLQRGKQGIVLTPKAFSVLRCLLEHAGQLVTRDELWRTVWRGVSVTDAALNVCVSEIRKALGDNPKRPRYVETVHRLGYRFIAPVSTEPARIAHAAPRDANVYSAPHRVSAISHFVGRQIELEQLEEHWGRALNGERQIVFVTGEPGIGKTTLVEEFLRREEVGREERLWIGRGQCIEHYGTGEAYLPVLDALGRLCRVPVAGRLVELLEKYAPAWLVQLPLLLGAAELANLQGKAGTVTHPRMLRELADAIEAISVEKPLILWLEDLHWSDYSTLEWLGFLARRRESARLLVLGTYRPVEVILRGHPLKNLKHELQMHGQCKELPLALLGEAAVMEYLNVRFTSPGFHSSSAPGRVEVCGRERLQELARAIYQRTDGNPLFMVNLVDYLAEKEILKTFGDSATVHSTEVDGTGRIDRPPGIVELIERSLERLNPDEQALLEAASVVGAEFPVAAVAAALDQPVGEIESCCARLGRQQQFVKSHGAEEWPDGTMAATFQFVHGVYRDVLYDRVPPGRRLELHRRVAERKETAWGERSGEIAAELAYHYRRAGKIEQTIGYLGHAAQQAIRRSAFTEGLENCQQGLALLNRLPQSLERDSRELSLRETVLPILWAIRGPFSSDFIEDVQRARTLAEKSGQLAHLIELMVFTGLSSISAPGRDLPGVIALADRTLELAYRDGSPASLFLAHTLKIIIHYFRGDLVVVEQHFAAAMKFVEHPTITRRFAIQNFGIGALNALMLGRFEPARQRLTRMHAITLGIDPFGSVVSGLLTAEFHLLQGDYEKAETCAAYTLELSQKHQFMFHEAVARCFLGRALAQFGAAAESVELARQGMTSLIEMGAGAVYGMWWLASSQAAAGLIGEATDTIEQALEENTGEYVLMPVMLTVRGGLKMKQGQSEQAEADFREALAAARRMDAKIFELLATMSLARLLDQHQRRDEARSMLAEIYGWFTEGFDSSHLREAKALLDTLAK